MQPPPEFTLDSNPVDALLDFTDWVRSLLDGLVEDPFAFRYSRFRFETQELQQNIGRAWQELKSGDYFAALAESIRSLHPATLERFGLSGHQLRMKLSLIRHLYDAYTAALTLAPLKKLLDAIDTLLKSLFGATGFGDALDEIKEAIGLSLVTNQ